MSDTKQLDALAFEIKWATDALAKAKVTADALIEAERKRERTVPTEDRFAQFDIEKPIPELTPKRYDFLPLDILEKHGLAYDYQRHQDRLRWISKWTDENIAAFEPILAEALTADALVTQHNADVTRRWNAILSAHGVSRVGRIDVASKVHEGLRKRFLGGWQTQTATQWLAERHQETGNKKSGTTLASIRADAVAVLAEQQRALEVDREKRRAAEAEANRLAELERENARLKMERVLNAPLVPSKAPAAKPSDASADPSMVRTRLLEIE